MTLSMFTDNARRGKSDENENTGLLKPPDARGNIPRSPSSDAVEKVRVNAEQVASAGLKVRGKTLLKVKVCTGYSTSVG